jgi:hypothetical protein
MIPVIITPAAVQLRARAAFARGEPLANCNMNWHSAAYQTWAAEYARLEAEAAMSRAKSDRHNTPPVQSAPAERKGLDRAQMLRLYDQLEPDGKRMVVELMETLIVLQEQLR